MTTIKSRSGRTELYIGRDHETKWVRMERDQDGMADSFATADLLAALDATANTDVKHRADAYEDATRWQTAAEENERWADEWKRKAEESEANAAAQIETVGKLRAERDEWKARAERWAESKESWKADAAEWQARAEKAEATVAAVAKIAKDMRTWGWQQKVQDWGEKLADTIDPKPELPSHDGALIVATFTIGSRTHTDVPIRRKGGVWSSLDDTKHLRSEVIESWKPARVVTEDAS